MVGSRRIAANLGTTVSGWVLASLQIEEIFHLDAVEAISCPLFVNDILQRKANFGKSGPFYGEISLIQKIFLTFIIVEI